MVTSITKLRGQCQLDRPLVNKHGDLDFSSPLRISASADLRPSRRRSIRDVDLGPAVDFTKL